jgi:phosphoribosylformylglycinamidine (FGAM) synthase PurS component
MIVPCCVEVALTIPDNEAETTLSTLRRLGLDLARLERADVYRFSLDAGREPALEAALRSMETIYNPNKHVLRLREDAWPAPGELWVHEVPHAAGAGAARREMRVAGRVLEGVHGVERFVAWRLFGAAGSPATAELVRRASDCLLCNPSFQSATMT